MPSAEGILLVTGAMLLWTLASIGYKFALGSEGGEERNPILCLAYRMLLVSVVMIILSIIFGNLTGLFALRGETLWKYMGYTLLCGIFTLAADICYFNALRYLDSSRVYPLINVQMLVTYPLALFIFGETIPSLMLVAAVLIIIGVLFVGEPDEHDKGMDALSEEVRKKNHTKGIILGLGTGVFFALGFIMMALPNRVSNSPIDANTSRIVMYTVIVWGYILITRPPLPKRSEDKGKAELKAYMIAGIFGVLSSGIGDLIYTQGVLINGAALSITIVSAAPLLNQLFAILFLKEKFRPRFLIGAVLIVIGNILVIF